MLELGQRSADYLVRYCEGCDSIVEPEIGRSAPPVTVRRPPQAEYPRCSADRADLEGIAS